VIDYARAAYPDLPLPHGVREMLLISAGVDPLDAATVAARRAAYNSMLGHLREKVLTAIGPFFEALAAEEAAARIARDAGLGGTP